MAGSLLTSAGKREAMAAASERPQLWRRWGGGFSVSHLFAPRPLLLLLLLRGPQMRAERRGAGLLRGPRPALLPAEEEEGQARFVAAPER